jgi:hypothetical protein
MLNATEQVDLVGLASFWRGYPRIHGALGPGRSSQFLSIFSQDAVAGSYTMTHQPQQWTTGLGLLVIPLRRRNWGVPHRQHRRDLAGAVEQHILPVSVNSGSSKTYTGHEHTPKQYPTAPTFSQLMLDFISFRIAWTTGSTRSSR